MMPTTLTAALLTRICTGPSVSSTVATTSSIWARSPASIGRPTTVVPGKSAAIAAATSRVRRSCTSVTTTRAPPAASRLAVAWPTPLPAAPVTSATRPSKRSSMTFSSLTASHRRSAEEIEDGLRVDAVEHRLGRLVEMASPQVDRAVDVALLEQLDDLVMRPRAGARGSGFLRRPRPPRDVRGAVELDDAMDHLLEDRERLVAGDVDDRPVELLLEQDRPRRIVDRLVHEREVLVERLERGLAHAGSERTQGRELDGAASGVDVGERRPAELEDEPGVARRDVAVRCVHARAAPCAP